MRERAQVHEPGALAAAGVDPIMSASVSTVRSGPTAWSHASTAVAGAGAEERAVDGWSIDNKLSSNAAHALACKRWLIYAAVVMLKKNLPLC
jgi:hypothetical protein